MPTPSKGCGVQKPNVKLNSEFKAIKLYSNPESLAETNSSWGEDLNGVWLVFTSD